MPFVAAGIPIIIVGTGNEDYRFIDTEKQFLVGSKFSVYEWDVRGILQDRVSGKSAAVQTLREALNWFIDLRDPNATTSTNSSFYEKGPSDNSVLFVFDGLSHMYDASRSGHSNPTLTRILKAATPTLVQQKKTVVIIGKDPIIPPELEGVASHLTYPRPSPAYMRKLVRCACSWMCPIEHRDKPEGWMNLTETDEVEIAMLLGGFRAAEAENILAMSIQANDRKRSRDSSIEPGFDIDLIRRAKVDNIQQIGGLEIVIPNKNEEEFSGLKKIGGGGGIKDWWNIRRHLFSEEAKAEGIDTPKGGVIFGPGGTGKDNVIEGIAEEVGWTVLYADVGAMKAPLQGQTHKNFRRVLEIAESQAPCFLVFSEFEKMFAGGMSGSASFDGGTSSEMYATFLNWMQRRKEPVFVWGLTNEIESIPMPALRAGRFDQIFFMDLPEVWEREEIFSVHLKRSGWDPVELGIDLPILAERTDGYTGAEIRKIVSEAIALKLINEGPKPIPLSMEHLMGAIDFVPAISQTYTSTISQLRKFAADGNFLRANSPEPRLAKGKKSVKVGASLRKEI